jgi:hypothetical protein
MRDPDFFMSSGEDVEFERVRRCWRVARLASHTRDDLLLVRVNPPVPAPPYGFGSGVRDLIVIASRHLGYSLFPVSSFPDNSLHVYVLWPLVDDSNGRTHLNENEYKLIACAELFPTAYEARLRMTIPRLTRRNAQVSLRQQVHPEFISEQPGEERLKGALTSLFRNVKDVTAAYLCTVLWQKIPPTQIALCVRSSGDPDTGFMADIAKAVGLLTTEPGRPQILFLLDDDQERKVRRVCTPFFEDG